jgi:superoxide dismutase, Fe-Mn family
MMINLFRRSFLFGAGALAVAPLIKAAAAQSTPAEAVDFGAVLKYPFVVPPLPYAYDGNEPAIDAQTMQLHHDKHHAAYVANLNAALKDHADLQAKPLHELLPRLADVPEDIRTAVRNNAGGHANHTMFWQVMGGKGGEPDGELAAEIGRDFGSVAKLKEDFDKTALRVFGSGWAMVLVDPEGKLALVARPSQDSPLMDGKSVLFGNDVWEHAYYLKYQNRRADYLAAWWSVLSWPRIGQRYAAAKAGTLTI